MARKEICLDYTYIDEFEWLGDKVPYEVEGNPCREYEKITARAAIFYSEEPKTDSSYAVEDSKVKIWIFHMQDFII